MQDNNAPLVMEELRIIKAMHTESMSRIADLCGEMKGLVVELRHAQKDNESTKKDVEELKDHVMEIRLQNATNQSFFDTAKSMQKAQWITIMAAAAAVTGTNLPFAKMFGG
jgi:flagellin-like hook-associated protein FlgL